MSRDGGRSGKTGRPVTPDEAELWDRLARTLDKVKAKPRVPSSSDDAPSSAASAPGRVRRAASRTEAPSTAGAPASVQRPQPAPVARRPPPLASPDRRAVRQVASGKTPVDARLDLHGTRQRDAHARLCSFLLDAQARGCRIVLVITGKGGEAGTADHLAGALGEPQRGVLRRGVPQWLEEPALRSVVLGYATAGVRHGGDGALYVWLRKGRDA
jgi:DNA-nicking Smr family endonuclease